MVSALAQKRLPLRTAEEMQGSAQLSLDAYGEKGITARNFSPGGYSGNSTARLIFTFLCFVPQCSVHCRTTSDDMQPLVENNGRRLWLPEFATWGQLSGIQNFTSSGSWAAMPSAQYDCRVATTGDGRMNESYAASTGEHPVRPQPAMIPAAGGSTEASTQAPRGQGRPGIRDRHLSRYEQRRFTAIRGRARTAVRGRALHGRLPRLWRVRPC